MSQNFAALEVKQKSETYHHKMTKEKGQNK